MWSFGSEHLSWERGNRNLESIQVRQSGRIGIASLVGGVVFMKLLVDWCHSEI